jgi:hypothetical protein
MEKHRVRCAVGSKYLNIPVIIETAKKQRDKQYEISTKYISHLVIECTKILSKITKSYLKTTKFLYFSLRYYLPIKRPVTHANEQK